MYSSHVETIYFVYVVRKRGTLSVATTTAAAAAAAAAAQRAVPTVAAGRAACRRDPTLAAHQLDHRVHQLPGQLIKVQGWLVNLGLQKNV